MKSFIKTVTFAAVATQFVVLLPMVDTAQRDNVACGLQHEPYLKFYWKAESEEELGSVSTDFAMGISSVFGKKFENPYFARDRYKAIYGETDLVGKDAVKFFVTLLVLREREYALHQDRKETLQEQDLQLDVTLPAVQSQPSETIVELIKTHKHLFSDLLYLLNCYEITDFDKEIDEAALCIFAARSNEKEMPIAPKDLSAIAKRLALRFPCNTIMMEDPIKIKGDIIAGFSPNGRYIAIISKDGKTVRILDLTTKIVSAPVEHDNLINSMHFSPDSEFIVTASADRLAKICNIDALFGTTGQQVVTATIVHNLGVNCARFSMDGKYVVTASKDRIVRIFDFTSNDGVGTIYNNNSCYAKTTNMLICRL